MIKVRFIQSEPQKRADFICYDVRFEIEGMVIGETIPLIYWDLDNYINQWKDGIEHIKNHSTSCLITWIEQKRVIDEDEYDSVLRWLVLYKKNNKIIIQQLCFWDKLYDNYVGEDSDITLKNCYDFIPKYSSYYPIYAEYPQVFWKLDETQLSEKFGITMYEGTYQICEGWPTMQGAISIGTFTTDMYIPIKFWSINDYKQQWKEGIDRLKNYSSTCLVSGISSPIHMDMILLYKRNKIIFIYFDEFNGEYYPEQVLNKVVTKENCYDFIPDEQEHLEKYRVKEWEADLKEFDGLEVIWPEE